MSDHFPYRNSAFEKIVNSKIKQVQTLVKNVSQKIKECYLYSIEHGRLSLNGFIEVGIPTTRGSSLWYCSVYCFNS